MTQCKSDTHTYLYPLAFEFNGPYLVNDLWGHLLYFWNSKHPRDVPPWCHHCDVITGRLSNLWRHTFHAYLWVSISVLESAMSYYWYKSFYKHSVFQSEAQICLGFSYKWSLKICLAFAYLKWFKRANFIIWPMSGWREFGKFLTWVSNKSLPFDPWGVLSKIYVLIKTVS